MTHSQKSRLELLGLGAVGLMAIPGFGVAAEAATANTTASARPPPTRASAVRLSPKSSRESPLSRRPPPHAGPERRAWSRAPWRG